MPWMPGTMRVGLTASPAKSVRAKATNATRAMVHRIDRTGRMLDRGGGRAAQAPIGRPHRGQKFPLNNVPHRGHGQPTGAGGAANEVISVSRGYYLPDKSERFKRSLTIPDDPEIRAFVAEKIRTL